MRSHPLCPMAAPSSWYSHRQTPQEEFGNVTRMERQHGRVLALQTCHTQCTNPTVDRQVRHQQHDSSLMQRTSTLMQLDEVDLAARTAVTVTQPQEHRQSQIENNTENRLPNTATLPDELTPLR